MQEVMSENFEQVRAPRLFISYSWTDQRHVEWVVRLATDLKGWGVEAKIDQWHLREGQDAHSFMEGMVRGDEVDKVILICDKKYIDRANTREGGVGVESQIVTSDIFNDVRQTKFTALVLDSDESGRALLPNFMTSRIFIDFRDASLYSKSVQQLVRWAFDKPLYLEPEVGPRPKFLDEQIQFDPIQIPLGEDSSPKSEGLTELILEASRVKVEFPVVLDGPEHADDVIYAAIKSLPPLISQFINIFRKNLKIREIRNSDLDLFIEYIGLLYKNNNNGPSTWSGDVGRFYSQFILVSILSEMINLKRFNSAEYIISSKLMKFSHDGITAEMVPLYKINDGLRSIDSRNKRLKLNRISLHSDLIRETCESVGVDFVNFMQTDFVLYLCLTEGRYGNSWWPHSLLYAVNSHGAFPWFARAVVPFFRDRFLGMMGILSSADLSELIRRMESSDWPNIAWDGPFSNVNAMELGNMKEILASYQ